MGINVTFKDYEQNLFYGEEVLVEDVVGKMSSYWICDGSATVERETLAVINISSYHEVYASLLIFPDKLPIVSKKSTKELMLAYRKTLPLNYKLAKKLTGELYGKAPYYFSYMAKGSQLIPLDGDVRKVTDYVNIAYIKRFCKYSDHQVTLSFSTFFDLVVPIQTSRFKKRYQEYIECYICHAYMDRLIKKETTDFKPFEFWEGDLYKSFPKLIMKGIARVENTELIHERRFHEVMKSTPKNIVEESYDKWYSGDFDL